MKKFNNRVTFIDFWGQLVKDLLNIPIDMKDRGKLVRSGRKLVRSGGKQGERDLN